MMSGFLELLRDAFTLPTAVFSVLLILVVLYWTLSLGGLDLDLFEGAGESVEGLAEGAGEGLAEGLGEGLGEGVDGAVDALDGAADADLGPHGNYLDRTGLGEVPRSIVLTLFVVFGWVFCFAGMKLVPQFTSAAFRGVALALVVSAVSVVLAYGATALAVRPLARVLVIPHATSRHELVGRTCTVATLRVDERYGQAEVVDSNVPLLIQVRAATPNDLSRGTTALIFEYDPTHEVFRIAPFADV